MSVEAGEMITPNVRLVERLGEGAMGEVWSADNLALDTRVAVKVIHPDVLDEADHAIERFRREGRAAARIKTPHVVQIFDQGVTEEGVAYIVMELLEGESLAARLDRTGRLSLRQTAEIVTGVAKALTAAHDAGVIHRDIKPENIFLVPLDDEKLVKVLDFGIAKQVRARDVRRLTVEGMLIGTPEYMCRDVMLDASAPDAQADLWSLAVVTYQCLTGELPFQGNTIPVVCARVLDGEFEPPSTHRPDLPPDVDEWFRRALHPDPEQRFTSAKELAFELIRILPARVSDLEGDLAGGSSRLRPASFGKGTKIAYSVPPPASTKKDEDDEKPESRATLGAAGVTLPGRAPARRARMLWLLGAVVVVLSAAVWFVQRGEDEPPAPPAAALDSADAPQDAPGAETVEEASPSADTASPPPAATSTSAATSGPDGPSSGDETGAAGTPPAEPPEPSRTAHPPPTPPQSPPAPRRPPSPPDPRDTSPEALGF